jgi:protein SCO1/2
MRATPDGREVTQDAFQGSVTMLYFGYTFCPDVCPLVLQNVLAAADRMGDAARLLRFLFVTVDPGRDTVPVLDGYTKAFGPAFTGLSGDANALERLARRYRLAYSVTPSDDPRLYEVTHSAAVYVFDKALNARLLVASLATPEPGLDALAADLKRLANEPPSWKDWARRIA